MGEILDLTGCRLSGSRASSRCPAGRSSGCSSPAPLAQQTAVLVLDEPTNHLDIKYQLQLMELVRKSGCTVVAAIHDLNLAAGLL